MSDFSRITCKTEVTIACNGDTEFFEKMQAALEESSTKESPVHVKRWLTQGEESMCSYAGIIVLLGDTSKQYDVGSLAVSMEKTLPEVTGRHNSPLLTERVILCQADNTDIIDAFCELHGLDKEVMNRPDAAVSFWSSLKHNTRGRRNLRISRTVYQ